MSNPTTYTEELAEAILDGLWEGKTIPQIAKEVGDPRIKRRSIARWRENNPEFDKLYRAAMDGGAEALLDAGLEIVDDRDGDPDSSSRRIRADYREKLAKRKAPHLYSDRVTLAGDRDNPLHGMSAEELDKRIAELQAALQGGDGA